jgi:hypothetical protein
MRKKALHNATNAAICGLCPAVFAFSASGAPDFQRMSDFSQRRASVPGMPATAA